MNMANTYNLDTIISKYIHRPIISKNADLPPLYARVSGAKETESSIDAEGIKNPLWIKATESTFNSPTNVRRLFIGDTKVFIQYYQPPVMSGKQNNYWLEYSLTDEDRLDKMAQDIMTFNTRFSEAAAMGAKPPTPIKVTKTGMGAVANNWKMSNLEEIYITPSVILSDDIKQRINGAFAIFNGLAQQPTGKIVKSNIPQLIFESVNGGNIKNIRTRFPRLRTVAFATNLEQALGVSGAKRFNEGQPKSLDEAGINWYSLANKCGATQVCSIVVSVVPFDNSNDKLLNFITRPGIYKYDATILDGYVVKYKEQITVYARANRDKALGKTPATEEKEVTTKTEYEKLLDSMLDSYGEAAVQSTLMLVKSAKHKQELKDEISKMTKEGKEKYSKYVG